MQRQRLDLGGRQHPVIDADLIEHARKGPVAVRAATADRHVGHGRDVERVRVRRRLAVVLAVQVEQRCPERMAASWRQRQRHVMPLPSFARWCCPAGCRCHARPAAGPGTGGNPPAGRSVDEPQFTIVTSPVAVVLTHGGDAEGIAAQDALVAGDGDVVARLPSRAGPGRPGPARNARPPMATPVRLLPDESSQSPSNFHQPTRPGSAPSATLGPTRPAGSIISTIIVALLPMIVLLHTTR